MTEGTSWLRYITRLLWAVVATVLLSPVAYILMLALAPNDTEIAWVTWRISGTQRAGDTIVKGLESFHRQNGRYPSRLDELIPKYLDSLPALRVGRGWDYRLDGSSYVLSFGIGEYN